MSFRIYLTVKLTAIAFTEFIVLDNVIMWPTEALEYEIFITNTLYGWHRSDATMRALC